MPKALCLISLVASILIVGIFLIDAVMGLSGVPNFAPFGYASAMMDYVFIALGGVLIYLSWSTYREQR